MLINDETMNASMPLRSALQLGLSANLNQVQEAVKELRTGEPELTDWGDTNSDGYSKIMRHKEYSSENKETLIGIESNDILLIVLGQDGYSVFRESMKLTENDSRKIEDELSSLIGSDILDKYSREHQSSGFDRDCVNVRVTYVRDPEMLEDIDLERYFAISILEGSEIDFADDFLNWFTSSMADSDKVIPIVYSFSSSISPLIDNLSEDLASSTAASWLYSLNNLTPSKQLDFLLHAFNQLFIEYDYDNTNSHVRAIMEEDFLHVSRTETDIEALMESCKLTTMGHNYFSRFVGKAIDCHKKAYQKVKKLLLPDAFSRGENPREARQEWLSEIIENLHSEAANDPAVEDCLKALIGIHKNWSDPRQWRGEYSNEQPDAKLLRWATNITNLDRNQITSVFLNERNGRNFYGGPENHEIQQMFFGSQVFGHLETLSSLCKSLHIKYWPHFKRLFNITDSFRYGLEAEGLEPMYKKRIGISEISKIRSQVSRNLLNELFLNFTKEGGVVR